MTTMHRFYRTSARALETDSALSLAWRRRTARFALVACVALALLFFSAGVAQAVTVTVTTLADSGAGSLRQAMLSANSGDTIVFNIPGGGTINLLSALPIATQTGGLTIDGSNGGQGAIIIDGGSTSASTGDRVFFLGVKGSDNTGATATDAAVWIISNLTIRKGNARGAMGAMAVMPPTSTAAAALALAWAAASSSMRAH